MSTNSNKISVSIIIPSHNRQDSVLDAVKSLLEQTVLPDEIIVIDDGSNPQVDLSIFDNNEIAQNSLSLKLLRNEQAMGACYARNRGIEEANSKWIAFLDDDDRFLPNKLEIFKKCVVNTELKFDVFYHRALITIPHFKIKYISGSSEVTNDCDLYRKLLVGNFIGGTPMVIVSREALQKVDGFDENLPAKQDYDLWLRLAKHGYKFFFYKEQPLTAYSYAVKGGSISSSPKKREKAKRIFDLKYKEDKNSLSEEESFQVEINQLRAKVFSHYLNLDHRLAAKYNYRLFRKERRLKNFILSVLSLFSIKTIFWLRSKQN